MSVLIAVFLFFLLTRDQETWVRVPVGAFNKTDTNTLVSSRSLIIKLVET